MLVIAHRQNTIKSGDSVVFQHGVIVEVFICSVDIFISLQTTSDY